MARILVVGVVFIAAPCAFAELKPTRQPINANAAAETNFMLSPLCVSLRRPGEPAAWSLCSANRLFYLRPQIDLVLSAAKSALGPSRLSGRLIEITAIEG